jgi:hypothetical protein
MEVDLVPIHRPDEAMADLITGALGELSSSIGRSGITPTA